MNATRRWLLDWRIGWNQGHVIKGARRLNKLDPGWTERRHTMQMLGLPACPLTGKPMTLERGKIYVLRATRYLTLVDLERIRAHGDYLGVTLVVLDGLEIVEGEAG